MSLSYVVKYSLTGYLEHSPSAQGKKPLTEPAEDLLGSGPGSWVHRRSGKDAWFWCFSEQSVGIAYGGVGGGGKPPGGLILLWLGDNNARRGQGLGWGRGGLRELFPSFLRGSNIWVTI